MGAGTADLHRVVVRQQPQSSAVGIEPVGHIADHQQPLWGRQID
jgi:hypothetical protein